METVKPRDDARSTLKPKQPIQTRSYMAFIFLKCESGSMSHFTFIIDVLVLADYLLVFRNLTFRQLPMEYLLPDSLSKDNLPPRKLHEMDSN